LAVENNQYKKKENVSRDNPLDKPVQDAVHYP
jgi:hypothetical protein